MSKPRNPTIMANKIPLFGKKHNNADVIPKTTEMIPKIVTVFFIMNYSVLFRIRYKIINFSELNLIPFTIKLQK